MIPELNSNFCRVTAFLFETLSYRAYDDRLVDGKPLDNGSSSGKIEIIKKDPFGERILLIKLKL
jgi:GT2 family glycosyltransferase